MRSRLPIVAVALGSFACAGGELDTSSTQAPVVVCAEGPTIDGIDVSYWQGTIDWPSVAAAGIDFAYIRVTHGLTVIDTQFDRNWAGARESGIVRGAYQYLEPSEDAAEQAELMLDLMGPLEPGDLPPVLDVEEADALSPGELAAAVQAWMDVVEPAIGRPPVIYTGKYFWNDNVDSDAFADHPLWIAQWNVTCPDLPAAWSEWVFHQTSATGSIPGISGNVDTDLFNGTIDDLLDFAAGEVEPPPPCEPIPPEGRVIDEKDPCFDAGGPASAIRHVTEAGWDGDLLWTYTTDWEMEDNFAVWTLELAEEGRYLVEIHTPAPWAESKQAAYVIAHAGATDTIVVDQTATDGWTSLGELAFAAGGEQSIRLSDNTGEALATQTQIVFDAIRLTRLDATGIPPIVPPRGDPPGYDPSAPAACAVAAGTRAGGGRGAGWALIALIAAAVRVVRATSSARSASAARDRRG